MSQSIKGSITEKNILTAFIGESQARNKYTYFSSVAKKEGFIQISKVFEETANHEKEHAKRLFKLLKGGEAEITASFPAGVINSTLENLQSAASGENYEYTTMYPEFAQIAKEENFDEVAKIFESIAISERYHEERFKAFICNIEKNEVFTKAIQVTWRCINCGYNHNSVEAPKLCPACNHKQSYFELLATNW